MARPLIALHEAAQSEASSAKEAQKKTVSLVEQMLRQDEISPEDVSIQDCWDVFVKPAIVESGKEFDDRYGDYADVQEEVVSSMFPYVTNKLIHPLMIREYETDISDMLSLFTEVDSDHREEDIAGTTAGDSALYTEEGMPYPDSELGEKRVSIKNFKFGHGIALTVEMVRFNQTGELQRRARNVGSNLANVIEEFMAYRIADTAWSGINEATSQALVINGTRRAMYADDHSSWDTYANDNAVLSGNGAPSLSQTKTMVNLLKGMKDEKGKPVRVRPRAVFGHAQLEETMNQFFNIQQFDLASANRDQNIYRGKYNVVTSQFAPDTGDWFLGDFARQFRVQWVWRPKTAVDRSGDPKRDILVAYYSSAFLGVGAEDYRFVAKNDG